MNKNASFKTGTGASPVVINSGTQAAAQVDQPPLDRDNKPPEQPPVVASDEIDIKTGPFNGVFKVHPVARLFPLLTGKPYDDLKKSIQKSGQQEPVVLDGEVFLDGRNRVSALNELGIAPWIIQFAELKTGLNPGVWVATRNLERRHLSADQQLAILARYRAWCKEEKARQQAETEASARSETNQSGDQDSDAETSTEQAQDEAASTTSEYTPKSAENTGKRKRGRPRGTRSEAEDLATAAKQSRYRAEKMLKLRKQSPALAAEVEAGRLTLKDAFARLKAQQSPPAKKASSRRTTKANKIEKVLSRVETFLAQQACKLEPSAQGVFWQRIRDIAGCHTVPKDVEREVGSALKPTSSKSATEARKTD